MFNINRRTILDLLNVMWYLLRITMKNIYNQNVHYALKMLTELSMKYSTEVINTGSLIPANLTFLSS